MINNQAPAGEATPSRLFDAGVVLAFAVGMGIAICDGPEGIRLGAIDFALLDKGQRDFSANGLTVQLEELDGGQFKPHIWDTGLGTDH